MPSMFEKASTAFRGNSKDGEAGKHEQEGESLTTILETDEDRGALTLLICDITEAMRKQLLDTFDPKETGSQEDDVAATVKDGNGDSVDAEKAGEDAQGSEQERKTIEKQKSGLAKREKEVSDEKMAALKAAALNFFDDWRDSVILRVGEVVNSKKTAEDQSKQHSKPETASSGSGPALEGIQKSELDNKIDEALVKFYPPIETPLRKMDKEKRVLVLHSALLLMLSLEHYRAHSRTLLLYLTTSLGLSVTIFSDDESKIAQGLLAAAEQMSADEETKKRADDNRTARRWKMGAAGVAGAALIGITGGLAAPFLAAGVGTVLGGIGLGATATAGYLGALAGSGVLVGSLFGAYGAKMTSNAMERYTRDVQDFAFVPVRKQGKSEGDSHRLRVAIGISGWLSNEDEIVAPWKVIGPGQESFALRYELEALVSLGNSLRTLITSVAWKVARTEIIKRTVFAALMAGLWPISLTNAGRIIDNPWSVANQRAQKAGEVLADALINKAQGERPVTLIGYSLGAKVIYFCLQELARRHAFGLIENAVLLGAPTPCSSAEWRRVRSVVTGRVVNAYSTEDYILAFLYRSSGLQYGVAGLQPILNVKGVENVNISDLVEGHTLYRHAAGPIFKRIGFEDIDVHELKHEERKLQNQEEDEREQREAAGGKPRSADADAVNKGVGEDEVQKMEEDVGRKNEQGGISRMMEKVNIKGNASEKS
ncbi:Uu.00g056690.m01.CDS01 [Anthostomella pinea]|uniref:Uu.00g056690.m01.CDS01 n=1 Tax=Anthostomella pinea TaxID=933095 RepID=A0AAI8YM48_9PEZI|nr:Uu.00g056690.m01.CDS01 [Anthostomella pinea]